MQESFKKLNVIPDCQLIDGNRFKKFNDIPYYTIIKGDGIQMQIAAASILAKVHRDHLMNKLHEEFPHYNWNKNMGYPTKKHLEALEEFGVTKYHRLSYKPVLNILQKQITLFDGV
jgi:ribonuclease HII